MLLHYIKIALRTILRRKVFSFINLFGLAISMAVCLLIMLMVTEQKKYDTFHVNKDRIYRILTEEKNNPMDYGTTPIPLLDALENDYDVVEHGVRVGSFVGGDVAYEDRAVTMAGLYAGEDFFKIFSFELEAGDPATALTGPFKLVVTREAADRLFPNENPVGKTVTLNDRGLTLLGIDLPDRNEMLGDFTITGIMKAAPEKTHIKAEILVSDATLTSLIRTKGFQDKTNDWSQFFNRTSYVMLKSGKSEADLQLALNQLTDIHYEEHEPNVEGFRAQPLPAITPGPFINNPLSFRMPIEGIYFLSLLAILVMVSACFNYTNLSIARSLTRAREIGVRKVSGAFRRDIFFQFMGEAVIMAVLALLLAIVLLDLIKLGFSQLWINQFLAFELSSANVLIYLGFLGFAIFIGLLAGAFPALYLSSLTPIKVLNKLAGLGKKRHPLLRGIGWRKALLISQFSLSLIFIISSAAIFFQLRYLMDLEYGFNKENVINVKLQGNDHRIFAQEMERYPDVSAVAASNVIPATGIKQGERIYNTLKPNDTLDVMYLAVDQHYLAAMEIPLIAGQNFPDGLSAENEQVLLLNEVAVRQLGYDNPEDILGEFFSIGGREKSHVKIIGVVGDFRHGLWMDQIEPLMLRYKPDIFGYANIRINGHDMAGTLAHLESSWRSIDRTHALEYSFLDQDLANTHSFFGDLVGVIGMFALLAITIACLGLLGMAIFTTESRLKEIGIRKVLGASPRSLVLLLSRSYIYLLLIATVIGGPLAYFLNNLWLQEFAFRISYDVGITLMGGVLLLLLGLLTVGSQTLRAAQVNPVETLRDE